MNFEIGDTVVHWTHGLGKVVAIDEKNLVGINQQYYVVEVDQFKFWVPVEDGNRGSIRHPMESVQFKALFDILRMPGAQLPDHPYKRKNELRERMQKWTAEGLCHLIRDLTNRSHAHPLNQNDSSVLLRAKEYLLDEWELSLGVERSNAQGELEGILREDPLEPKGE